MLGKLYKDLKNGESVLLKNSAGTVILKKSNVAYLFNSQIEDDYLLVFSNTNNDDFGSLFFDIVKIKGNYSNLKTKAKPYDYKKIEKELLKEIQKYGINRLFTRLSKIQNIFIYKKAQIFAALEVFTGETFKTDEKVQRFEITKEDGTKFKQIALFDENEASWKGNDVLNVRKYDTVPFRRMIDNAKKDLEGELFIFTCILMLWQFRPIYRKVSSVLAEKKYQTHTDIENTDGIKELVGGEYRNIEEGFMDQNNNLDYYSFLVVFDVLEYLYSHSKNNRFWVLKGKPRKDIYKIARDKDIEIIDTNKLRNLTGHTDKLILKRIKKSLLDLPNAWWYVKSKPDKEGRQWTIKLRPVRAKTADLKQNDKLLIGVVEMIPEKELFEIKRRFITYEERSFSRLLYAGIPNKSLPHAALLLTYLMNYYNIENNHKVSYISLKVASELIGWKSKYDQRRKTMVKNEVIRYLEWLKKSGHIECYNHMKTGQFRIERGN
jgi:hypothetical protein